MTTAETKPLCPHAIVRGACAICRDPRQHSPNPPAPEPPEKCYHCEACALTCSPSQVVCCNCKLARVFNPAPEPQEVDCDGAEKWLRTIAHEQQMGSEEDENALAAYLALKAEVERLRTVVTAMGAQSQKDLVNIIDMRAERDALKAEVERLEQRSGCEHCSDRRRVAEAERDILAAKLAEVEKERYETEAWFINAAQTDEMDDYNVWRQAVNRGQKIFARRKKTNGPLG